MFKIVTISLLVLLLSAGLTHPVSARLGVGVGTGSIEVDEHLRPGGIYNLPSISVFNTGDEGADYTMSVAWHEDQPELRPMEDWFRFIPNEFYLEPGKAQAVKIEIHLPVRVEPGDYFAYIEAGPLQLAESGEATIGLAAASKFSFTVEPANLWWAMYYKALGLWRQYSPWTYVGLGLISITAISLYLRGKFSLQPRRIKLD